ncbi:MAG: WYL domain-containing protein [Pseudomonadales bacterium]|nr:WYL domain-containing protein [Pseudomonadales bacterium]
MMNKEWPLRWDLLLRYRLIEIIVFWEGRLTTNHLIDTFGIGRQQASKDINNYNNKVGVGNLVYDKFLKGYKPTPQFKPAVTSGTADEYLHLLNRNNDLSQTFDTLPLATGNTEILHVPVRNIDPSIIRAIVTAARQQKRLDVDYVSVNNPNREGRVIAPHTIVHTGLRWHVRAWCEKNQDYRDFVLSRFRGVPDIMDLSEHNIDDDTSWNTPVTIKLKPDTRLSREQKAVIARDYGMTNGVLKIATRGSLVQYALQQLHVDDKLLQGKPSAQQIIISNYSEIQTWLFR